MKNIHILPTDNPSRLRINPKGKLILSNIPIGSKGETQNIYITSDEEIKEGDWCMYLGLSMTSFKVIEIEGDKLFYGSRECFNESLCKKIILTTDQELITDGVQAIDDEFLEWFVKNSSCEDIKIGRVSVNCSCANQSEYRENANVIKENNTCHLRNNCETKFQIIIPKEEALYDYGWCKGNIVLPNEEPKQENENYLDSFGVTKSEIEVYRDFNKQETLEEVADNWLYDLENTNPSVLEKNYPLIPMKFGFIEGAKWQQEQNKNLYNEKEVYWLLIRLGSDLTFSKHKEFIDTKEWFKQFKKK